MEFQDLTGQKEYMMTFLKFEGRGKNGQAKWLCRCDCDNEKIVYAHHVKSGNAQSCGCIAKGERRKQDSTTHGMSFTSEWNSYHSRKKSCNPKFADKYPRHAGRGIEFRFSSFEDFYKELGPKPEPKSSYSCDRIDNDGHYEIGNVRWATKWEQAGNRRCDNCAGFKERILELETEVEKLQILVDNFQAVAV